jgi:hypothetical protein
MFVFKCHTKSISIICGHNAEFIGALAYAREEPVSFVMYIRLYLCPSGYPSVCLSVRMYEGGSHKTQFREI